MENSEFLERIQQYAVRIGKAGDNELYGSGTLFLVSKKKKSMCSYGCACCIFVDRKNRKKRIRNLPDMQR